MPVDKSNVALIDIKEVIHALNHTWKNYVNLEYEDFEAVSYHPVEEIETYLERILKLKALLTEDNHDLYKPLTMLGIYVLSEDIYRFQGYIWTEVEDKPLNKNTRQKFIDFYADWKKLVIEYFKDWHTNQKVMHYVNEIETNLDALSDWYATVDVSIYDELKKILTYEDMFKDKNYTETDWYTSFDARTEDEYLTHTAMLESIDDGFDEIIDMIGYPEHQNRIFDMLFDTLLPDSKKK